MQLSISNFFRWRLWGWLGLGFFVVGFIFALSDASAYTRHHDKLLLLKAIAWLAASKGAFFFGLRHLDRTRKSAVKPEELLAQFPSEVTLRASRLRHLRLLIPGSALILIPVLTLGLGGQSILLYLSQIFLLLVGVPFVCVQVYWAIAGKPTLTLSQRGMLQDAGFKKLVWRWEDTRNFRVGVLFYRANVYFEARNERTCGEWKTTLFASTYKMNADDLLQLIIAWREKSLSPSPIADHLRKAA